MAKISTETDEWVINKMGELYEHVKKGTLHILEVSYYDEFSISYNIKTHKIRFEFEYWPVLDA